MKRSRRGLSKKGLIGLVRKANKDGVRMWFYQGREFETLRAVVLTYRLAQLGLLQN